MNTIQVSLIKVPENRQRREFDPQALMELTESIDRNQLMQPIVLRDDGSDRILVAGERRLRAISTLWSLGGTLRHAGVALAEGVVPYVTMGQLPPLAAEEAELEENIRRKDLTWQEHADAVSRLHAMRSAQAAEAGRTQTVADTAQELHGRRDGDYQSRTRRQLLVANHLSDPDVAKAKSVEDAFKILKAKEERVRNIDLAAAVGRTLSSASHTLHHAESIEWMAAQPEGQFDVILTDPPYGMNAQDFGDAGGKVAVTHHYDDSGASWPVLMEGLARESFRLAKPQAHAYIFCDIDGFHLIKSCMESVGWYVFRTPLVNHKLDANRIPLPDKGPKRCYELILYAIKGGKLVTKVGAPDVIPSRGDENLGHGAQKPVAIYVDLLSRSVRPGDKVLDPFAGTGTIFAAAHELKCLAVGVERDPGSYGIALKRLQSIV